MQGISQGEVQQAMVEAVRMESGSRVVERDRRLLYAEGPRALAELATLLPAAPYLTLAPRGDGHPLLVLPGLGAGDRSTALLRFYLESQGFAPAPWQLGTNRGPAMDDVAARLAGRLEAVWRESGGRKISLIGWSLGGVYARLLARQFPGRVRQVITLGSPISGLPRRSGAYRAILRLRGAAFDRQRVLAWHRRVSEPLPGIPSTAAYSRSDGVVPWHIARQPASAIAENVEVYGSHLGMGFNASVLYLLAERLAQPEDAWRPFDRSGWKRWVYGPDYGNR